MNRRVTRARAPRTVPTISQIAAALILATSTAEAATDAGTSSGKGVLQLVLPAGVEAGADNPDPGAAIRIYVDGEEYAFGRTVEIPAGQHDLRFVYRSGETYTETIVLKEGETRSVSPTSCPYHPGQMMGGVQMPSQEIAEGGGGCCGSTRASRVAGHDLRALAAVVLAAAFTTRRRRKR